MGIRAEKTSVHSRTMSEIIIRRGRGIPLEVPLIFIGLKGESREEAEEEGGAGGVGSPLITIRSGRSDSIASRCSALLFKRVAHPLRI